MQVKIAVLGGADDGLEISLPALPATLGREGHPALPVQDRWASRLHCELFHRDGRLFIRDLASKHGTYVNGNRVEECPLQVGDQVMVGLTMLSVRQIDNVSVRDAAQLEADAPTDHGSGVGAQTH